MAFSESTLKLKLIINSPEKYTDAERSKARYELCKQLLKSRQVRALV